MQFMTTVGQTGLRWRMYIVSTIPFNAMVYTVQIFHQNLYIRWCYTHKIHYRYLVMNECETQAGLMLKFKVVISWELFQQLQHSTGQANLYTHECQVTQIVGTAGLELKSTLDLMFKLFIQILMFYLVYEFFAIYHTWSGPTPSGIENYVVQFTPSIVYTSFSYAFCENSTL